MQTQKGCAARARGPWGSSELAERFPLSLSVLPCPPQPCWVAVWTVSPHYLGLAYSLPLDDTRKIKEGHIMEKVTDNVGDKCIQLH